MDIHQKISIGIFGSLLFGTLVMYGTGGLSSSVLTSNVLENSDTPCPGSYMASYGEIYSGDKAKILEIQAFIKENCLGDVVAAKKTYCEARTKQLETYSALVKKYETCLSPAPTVPVKSDIIK